MIRIPFSRNANDEDRPSEAFSNFCRAELERRRDSDSGFDEKRFRAAVDLAVGRLRSIEGTEDKKA
jgi:hypothetical protein